MDLTFPDDDLIIYSWLYVCISLIFGMAVLSKFLYNEFRLGLRSILSLLVLLVGEPFCHFIVQGRNGLILFVVGCMSIYSILPAGHLKVDKKRVLITGCDSGFGHAVAKKLDSIGLQVYACCLYPEGHGAQQLVQLCSDRLKVIKLDVTKQSDIEGMKNLVTRETEESGLWGLVNNAGVWYGGELEMTSDLIMQKVLNVNLMGVMRVTQSLLPLVRRARGRIVNVSSVAGFAYMEGNGAYAISKSALETYSHTLRVEMKKFGVHVAIIEPTGFRTDTTENLHPEVLQKRCNEVWSTLDVSTQADYGRTYLDVYYAGILLKSESFARDFTPVIRAIRSGLMSKRPLRVYPCGPGAGVLSFVYPFLPFWIRDQIAGAIMKYARQTVKPDCLT